MEQIVRQTLGNGYRSPVDRARWAIRFLLLTGAIELMALVDEFLDRRMLSGEFLSAFQLTTYQSHRDMFTFLELGAFVISGIAFLHWVYLVHENLRELGRKHIRCGSKMAVGVWFIPILNLWRPKQLVEELLQTSDGESESSGLVVLWWAALIISGVLVRYTSGMSLKTLEDLQRQNMFEMVSLALSVGAAIGAVMIVRTVTARHEQHAGLLRS
jgi:hypothetical protein